MDRSITMRVFSSVLVLLLLLVATEMGPMVAEARTCESQSHRFQGTCVRKSNCAAVCQTEGFHGGHCRGFRRRCFCTKHCN
uniref:Knottins-like domain-containing protein n=1 Tax=Fagus sylvatica TaxID=28930 RepID=A0A2N9EPF5_FAGSY